MPPQGDEQRSFFRKEAPAIFEARFSKPRSPANTWALTSNVVFQAKKYDGTKSFSPTVNGVRRKVQCTVDMNLNLVLQEVSNSGVNVGKPILVSETKMTELLARKKGAVGFDTLECQAARMLCSDHTTSSKSSPLISGCIINNFAKSKTYLGHKLHLVLRTRTPFRNPLVSGEEAEYFLIGRVLDTDCAAVTYLGATNEDKNEKVAFIGADRPAAAS
jgi:hypothetical protein